MEFPKRKRKQSLTINHSEQLLFPEIDKLSPIYLRALLVWKAERLFDVANRIPELLSALYKKTDGFPSFEEDRFFFEFFRGLKEWSYKDISPVVVCARLGIIQENESSAFRRNPPKDIHVILLRRCFKYAQGLLDINIGGTADLLFLAHACRAIMLAYLIMKEPLPENMLKNFIELEHKVLTKTHEQIGYWTRDLRGRQGKGSGPILPGLVAAIKKYKEKPTGTSIGGFLQVVSKKKYTQKTPYQIDQYDLYADDGYIYHRDRTKTDRNGKIKMNWDRRIKITSLNRYYYIYFKKELSNSLS